MEFGVLFQFLDYFILENALAYAMDKNNAFHLMAESMIHAETEVAHLDFKNLMG